jgi:hypothetical protein
VFNLTNIDIPPTISNIADTSTNEDVFTGAIGFTVGDAETAVGSLTVSGTSSNTALVPNANIVFGGSGASRTVTITPAANQNGTATITVQVSDGTNTASDTFVLTVNAVNDAPSFAKGADQTVAEDAAAQSVANWASGLSAGPADESGQTLSFLVTNDNNGLFAAQPAIAPDGTLTYTPAANQSGSATVTVQARDNGGTANGGVDTSAPQTLTITITPVNDAPSAIDGSLSTNEDTPASGTLSATDVEGAPLIYSIVISPTQGTLTSFDAVTGAFSYTPNANVNGSDSFTFTANDGKIDSNVATISITIWPINDAPTLDPISDQSVPESAPSQTVALSGISAGPQTVLGWASGFAPGPADESGQTLLSYQIVSNSDAALFAAAPIIAADGTLTYTPKAGASGSATIGVVARDSGGTANGGLDISAVRTFTIAVQPLYSTYLPLASLAGTPDLVVSSISLTPSKSSFSAGESVEITVVVENRGDGVAGPFWVDLSINPDQPPTTTNQPWHQHCVLKPCFGLVWGVAELAPGASITLTSKQLPAGYSIWPGWFAAGTSDLYAYADSYSEGMTLGAVAESNEGNNQFHLGGLTVTGTNPALVSLQSVADLRQRPLPFR